MTLNSEIIVLSDSDDAEEAQCKTIEQSGTSKMRAPTTSAPVPTPEANPIVRRSPSSNECALAIAKLNRVMESGIFGNIISTTQTTASKRGNETPPKAPAFEKPAPFGFSITNITGGAGPNRIQAKVTTQSQNSSEISEYFRTLHFFFVLPLIRII